MVSDELFTRDEVLWGYSAQRGRTALYLIESRAGHLAARSGRAMHWQADEQVAQEEDLAFLQAFAEAKDPPRRPSIQEIEKFAPAWAELIPDNPGVRAAVAHLLAEKYSFTSQDIPHIQQVLGLDEIAVQRAYQRQYHQPVESIYVLQPASREQARWAWAKIGERLETLPPFWTAFALTLTETIGAGILAIPIAVAEIGALGGVILLIGIGAMNMITIAYMAEAVSRNGNIRYGKAYFGRLVADLLGREGSFILSIALILINLLSLLAYYTGLSTTLEDATRLPALVWIAVLFIVNLYFLRRRSINATVAAALLVGAVNILVIIILALLALPYIQPENLTYLNLPFVDGQLFDPGLLQLAFGVILVAYFGHTSMGNCAKIVLKRDPSARSLIRGSLAAQFSAIILYVLWVIAVNGAVPVQELSGEMGTALAPLAELVGREVYLFGAIFAVLAMGMAALHCSLGLYNLVQEWLPLKRKPVLSLPRRRGRLVLRHPKGGETLILSIVYLGLEDELPCLRLDLQEARRSFSIDVPIKERLDGRWIGRQMGHIADEELPLELLILDSGPDNVRLQLITSLEVSYEGDWYADEASLMSLLELPADQRKVFNWILRQREATQEEVRNFTRMDEREVEELLDTLVRRGFLRVVEGSSSRSYRSRLGAKKSRQLPAEIWDKLEVKTTAESSKPRRSLRKAFENLANEIILDPRGQFLLGSAPLLGIALLTAWLVAMDSESFSHTLSFLGTIVISLVGGAFPALLLSASRRKGEYVPGMVFRRLGAPLLAGIIFTSSLAVLALHGLIIWQNPLERAAAIAAGLVMLVTTALMIRRGIFLPRAVVELRRDHPKDNFANLQLTVNGGLSPAKVALNYPGGKKSLETSCLRVDDLEHLQSVEVQLRQNGFQDIKVWAHQISALGDSSSLPVRVELPRDGQIFDLRLSQGEIIWRPGEANSSTEYPIRLVLEG